MKKTSNIGITGVESIRIGEMLICDLPIAESAIAKQQMPLAEDNERKNKIKNVLKEYPTQTIDYLEGRIRESENSILKISAMKDQSNTLISEYTTQITLCKFRDEEVARIDEDDPERDIKIKDLFKRFPPYQVPAMEQQLIQSGESVERADEVIATEYKSIAEMRELKGLCEQRDLKLRHLNAAIWKK